MSELWMVPVLAAAVLAVIWPLVTRRREGPGRSRREDETGIWLARRERVLSALRELEADREAGNLSEADYRTLRRRYEAEAGRVLRRLRALGAPGAPASRGPDRRYAVEGARADSTRTTRALSGRAPWMLGSVLFLALAGILLARALRPRAAGDTITGNDATGQTRSSERTGQPLFPVDTTRLHEMEARIRADSTDVEALNELAHLWIGMQRFGDAADLSMRALRQDPRNAPAISHIGVVLWASGELDMAMTSFDNALRFQPDYHEALLFKGIVLFAGLRDFPGAVDTWERYLEVAPPDANTDRVRAMLESARRAAASVR